MATEFITIDGKDRIVRTLQDLTDSAQARLIQTLGPTLAQRSKYFVTGNSVHKIDSPDGILLFKRSQYIQGAQK